MKLNKFVFNRSLDDLTQYIERFYMEETAMDELKKYIENSSYCVSEIAQQLIELSNLEPSKELREELEEGLCWLKSAAENNYNQDYFRVLYNVLLVIAGMEVV